MHKCCNEYKLTKQCEWGGIIGNVKSSPGNVQCIVGEKHKTENNSGEQGDARL